MGCPSLAQRHACAGIGAVRSTAPRRVRATRFPGLWGDDTVWEALASEPISDHRNVRVMFGQYLWRTIVPILPAARFPHRSSSRERQRLQRDRSRAQRRFCQRAQPLTILISEFNYSNLSSLVRCLPYLQTSWDALILPAMKWFWVSSSRGLTRHGSDGKQASNPIPANRRRSKLVPCTATRIGARTDISCFHHRWEVDRWMQRGSREMEPMATRLQSSETRHRQPLLSCRNDGGA
jgi:hypothetical protein